MSTSQKALRILLLSWNFPPSLGGIEYVVERVYQGLRRSGHSIKVVTSFSATPERNSDISRCPRKGLVNYLPFALFEGWKVARNLRPEIIVNGSIASTPAAWVLSKILRVPMVVFVYGSDVKHGGWLYQWTIRFFLRAADGIVTCSGHTRDLAVAIGCDAKRVRVIHPGVDLEKFERRPEIAGDSFVEAVRGRRVLLSVGRLIRRKGVLEFVEHVMPHLVDRHEEVFLYVVGDDAKSALAHKERMKERIRSKVEQLGLQHHVELLGEVPEADLIRLYFLADILVLPCLEIPGDVEGFGIVLLEAAVAGTPSVATRTGGIPEAVQDGRTGLLSEPADFPALTANICTLLEDEDRRLELAHQGARRARETFSWASIIRQYERFFEAVLEASSPS